MRISSGASFSLAVLPIITGVEAASIVISSQNPTNYWTLDETSSPLTDSGTGNAVGGTLQNGASGNGPSLLANGSGSGILLNGTNQVVTTSNSTTVNAGNFASKTLSLAFNATTVDANRRILWEQGGATRGINFYVQRIGDVPTLVMNSWNLAESNWGPVSVSVAISEDTTYHAAFVLNGDPDNNVNTDDGTVTGYLNGLSVGSSGDAGFLRQHNDGIGIGRNNGGDTIFADGSGGAGTGFHGVIDEVAQWNTPLTADQIAAQAGEFIPEPGTSILGGLGALLLLRRRR